MADERRIPVFRAVRLTYGLLGRFWWQATVRNIGAVILLLAVYVGHELILPASEMMEMQGRDPAENLRASLLNMIYLLVLMVPWTMLFVALFRIGMSNGIENNGRLGLRWGKRETCAFLRGVLLGLILVAIAIPLTIAVALLIGPMMDEKMAQSATNPLAIWPMMLALFVLVGLPVGYWFVRWLPYAAAPAIDQSLSLGAAWRATTGNGWRILAIWFLVSLPFTALSILNVIAYYTYGITALSLTTYISWLVSILWVYVTSFVTAVIYDYLVPKPAATVVDTGYAAEGPAH